MKLSFSISTVLAVTIISQGTEAFPTSALSSVRESTSLYGYVPSGFTPEQYKKFKEAEAKKKAKKNLGRMGPKGVSIMSVLVSLFSQKIHFSLPLLPTNNVQDSKAALSRVSRRRSSVARQLI